MPFADTAGERSEAEERNEAWESSTLGACNLFYTARETTRSSRPVSPAQRIFTPIQQNTINCEIS